MVWLSKAMIFRAIPPSDVIRSLSLAACSAACLAGAARADVYVIDKDHTEVRAAWNHLGLSKQSGRFLDVSGVVEFDPAAPEATSADIAIKVSSFKTGVIALDRVLTGAKEYFDVGAFPVATFKSDGVSLTSDKTARMTGGLTLNGIARPVTLDVTWNFTGDHPMAAINPAYRSVYASGFSATAQIRRSEWGIDRTIPYVSDEVGIVIEAELHRKEIKTVEATSAATPKDMPFEVRDGAAPEGVPSETAKRGDSPEETEAPAGPEASGEKPSDTLSKIRELLE